MSDQSTVFFVDSDPGLRETAQAIAEMNGFKFASFDIGEDFLSSYCSDTRGCVVLSLDNMPGRGAATCSAIADLPYTPPLVVLIDDSTAIYSIVQVMKLGVVDVLQRPISLHSFEKAIVAGVEADEYQHQALLRQRELKARIAELTTEEIVVLDLLSEGFLNKQIAAKLGMSVRSVESRRSRLLRKMNVQTVPQLVRIIYSSTCSAAPLGHHAPVASTHRGQDVPSSVAELALA